MSIVSYLVSERPWWREPVVDFECEWQIWSKMPDDKFSKLNGTRPGVRARRFEALVLRAFDIVFSLIGLVIAAPLFPAIAVLVKLNSKGPVFFPAKRVGKDMKLFPMHKFRTMLARCPTGAKRVFSVKPGLVGPVVVSSLRGDVNGRNEEELYPKGVDPKQYYIEHILPEKVKIDLYHLSRQTVGTYLKIIVAAVKETVFGAFSARQADHSTL